MAVGTEPIGADRAADDRIAPRIAAELRRIEDALHDDGTGAEQWGQLYAAQQALCWAANEDLAAPPYPVIMQGKVHPPTPKDTPAD